MRAKHTRQSPGSCMRWTAAGRWAGSRRRWQQQHLHRPQPRPARASSTARSACSAGAPARMRQSVRAMWRRACMLRCAGSLHLHPWNVAVAHACSATGQHAEALRCAVHLGGARGGAAAVAGPLRQRQGLWRRPLRPHLPAPPRLRCAIRLPPLTPFRLVCRKRPETQNPPAEHLQRTCTLLVAAAFGDAEHLSQACVPDVPT